MDKLKKYFVKVLPLTVATILILSIFLIVFLLLNIDLQGYFFSL